MISKNINLKKKITLYWDYVWFQDSPQAYIYGTYFSTNQALMVNKYSKTTSTLTERLRVWAAAEEEMRQLGREPVWSAKVTLRSNTLCVSGRSTPELTGHSVFIQRPTASSTVSWQCRLKHRDQSLETKSFLITNIKSDIQYCLMAILTADFQMSLTFAQRKFTLSFDYNN